MTRKRWAKTYSLSRGYSLRLAMFLNYNTYDMRVVTLWVSMRFSYDCQSECVSKKP